MAQLPRRISSSLLTLFLISYLGLSNLVLAQLSVSECAQRLSLEYRGLYNGIQSRAPSDPQQWCPLWAAICNYVYRTCQPATCDFTNYDPTITTQFNPALSGSYTSFSRCRSCDVKISDPLLRFEPSILVPTRSTSPSQSTTRNTPGPTVISDRDSPKDMLAENTGATAVTAIITVILVIVGIVGSLIALKSGSNNAAFLSPSTGIGAGAGTGAAAAAIPIAIAKIGSGSGQSVIDAVTLLLHFQTISSSGFLSISYPTIYRYFCYNFAWANFILDTDALKDAARRMGDPSCVKNLNWSGPDLTHDQYTPTGMTLLGSRYKLDSATFGGLVYLSAIIGVAIALGVFVLVGGVLRILNAVFSNKLQAQVDLWPSRASSMSLRLFVWVLGSISTFAIYQFVEPCSSRPLIAFASVEFVLIIFTLLMVTIFIIKTAKSEGPEALYPISESEESKYSRKWGSLYSTLKPTFYWFFIPDYVWVLAKSMIVGLGQGSGIGQCCALLGVELGTLLALLVRRPYDTAAGNTFQILSACKRVFAQSCLFVFWNGFGIGANTKRNMGLVLMVIESIYTAVIIVFLLLNGAAAFMKWNAQRKERKRFSAISETTKTSSPLPDLNFTDSYYSNTSPMQAKFQ